MNLTQKIIRYRLGDDSFYGDITREIFSCQFFYVPAASDTPQDLWNRKKHAPFSENGEMYIFMQKKDAEDFALLRDITDAKGAPMITKVRPENAAEIIRSCIDSGSIDKVRFYSSAPVCVVIEKEFFKGEMPAASGFTSDFKYVPHVKEVLSTVRKEDRNKIPDAGIILNAHELIARLLVENQISFDEFDALLNFAPGFTKRFCEDISGNEYKREALSKMLSYFDLGEYLLIYKSFSKELAKDIESSSVDKYSIRPVRAGAKEVFTIEKITQGKMGGALIYRLDLKSPVRDFSFAVSNNFDCIVGGRYEITGLEAAEGAEPKDSEAEITKSLIEEFKEGDVW